MGGLFGAMQQGNGHVVTVRDGRLYEETTPLRVRSNADGLFVGCTFVTWKAWEELERRVKKLRGQE